MIFTDSIFIAETEVESFCQSLCLHEPNLKKIKFLIKLGLLPVYSSKGLNFFLKNDLLLFLDVFSEPDCDSLIKPRHVSLFLIEEQHVIKINCHTTIDLACDESAKDATFFSAIPNLVSHGSQSDQYLDEEESIQYFSGARLTTVAKGILKIANSQLSLSERSDMIAVTQFASSAYYMGSKRQLCGFLAEAISSVLPESGVVLDLMCGSGVASGAFSKVWRTFASDAQDFCKTLAVVHGGGFTRPLAESLLSKLLPIAQKHFECLQEPIIDFLEAEENIFCSDLNDSLIDEYRKFVIGFPTLSRNEQGRDWNPEVEVARRKIDPGCYPYCLFTSYFANSYFGLRQCAEIDSLRFAIDQIEDDEEKSWALGALLATLSALGTTFGGHFAQPGVVDFEKITLSKLSKVITKRSFSITHEFTVRLLNLAEKSEGSSRPVEIVSGPWEIALAELGKKVEQEQVLVYVDAPYTREEYSRFYHVLETLVNYTYPSCTGKGLTPTPEERFKSEFFTKTRSKVESTLVKVISSILDKGWACAWSYADSGAAEIYEVIKQVCSDKDCCVRSYSAPFVHKSQGGARPKSVTEYLMLFTPTEGTWEAGEKGGRKKGRCP